MYACNYILSGYTSKPLQETCIKIGSGWFKIFSISFQIKKILIKKNNDFLNQLQFIPKSGMKRQENIYKK